MLPVSNSSQSNQPNKSSETKGSNKQGEEIPSQVPKIPNFEGIDGVNFNCSKEPLTEDLLEKFAKKYNDKNQMRKEQDDWGLGFADILNPLKLIKKLTNKLFHGEGKAESAKEMFKFMESCGIPIRDSYSFRTKDGYRTRVLYSIGNDPTTTPTLVFISGRDSGIEAFKASIKKAGLEGFNVLCLLPRGSYGNPGIPNKEGWINDFVGMMEGAVTRLGIPLELMQIEAHSLGTAIATHGLKKLCEESKDRQIGKIPNVNLITPILSQIHTSHHFAKFLPEGLIRLISGDNTWDNAKAIKGIGRIVDNLNIYGAGLDWVTPPEEILPSLQKAREEAGIPGTVAISPKADHNSALPKY